MDRPRLVLRRFGALSFGLGYFDGGEWIDHTAIETATASRADRQLLDVVHTWVACCGDAPTDRIGAIDRPAPAIVTGVVRRSVSS